MMNLGSYFQSELKEIHDNEGILDDHYNMIFQSQNACQKLTKKQIAEKLREYEFQISQIDAQEDPMAMWEEYLDFLFTYQDRTSNVGNEKIFQALEQFTKYSTERDYIKQDIRCVRFWVEYSNGYNLYNKDIMHLEKAHNK